MLALYGPNSPVGVHLQHTRWGGGSRCCSSRCRSWSARCSRCCSNWTARSRGGGVAGRHEHRHLHQGDPAALLPAMLSGAGLAFSRAIGEFGSVVLIGGAIPGRRKCRRSGSAR